MMCHSLFNFRPSLRRLGPTSTLTLTFLCHADRKNPQIGRSRWQWQAPSQLHPPPFFCLEKFCPPKFLLPLMLIIPSFRKHRFRGIFDVRCCSHHVLCTL